ncbi:MAG TPA: hypothetical protein DCZ59_07390 [Bacteroidetes bacterium]|nr:hypothetical protein [Bacteroidota bacterium]
MKNYLRSLVMLSLTVLVCIVNIGAQTVTIEPIPNNTRYDDFAPSITNHGKLIIYSSDRDGKGQRLMSMEQSNGMWSSSKLLNGDVNDAEHAGVGALTPDGQSMIFSATNHDVKGAGRTDLYIAQRRSGKWRDIGPLGSSVNSSSYDAQPSLSSDGRTLYFVSDRPGGQGATDIYTSVWDGTEWSIATPVAGLNTASGEMSPVIAPDGRTLYFASDRSGGAGGYDIYVATVQNGSVSNVRRLREPINSPADELFYTALPNSDRAMMSRTTASGDYDNFMVTPNPFPGDAVTLVEGIVRDEASRDPLGAEITVTDLKSGKRVATLRSDDATGAYYVTLTAGRVYSITAVAEDHVFHSERYEVPSGAKGRTVKKDIDLSRIRGGSGQLLVFFDTDKSELKSESMPELERVVALLRENSSVRMRFDGHTDDQGTDDYNDGLSQRRADAVRTYVISAGIEASRLTAKGYGKRRPMVRGNTDEDRQQNRRVEMKIME